MKTLDDLLIDAGAALDERCADVAVVPGQDASMEPRSRWLAASAAAALVAVSGVAFWATRDDRSSDAVVSPPTSPMPISTAVSDSSVASNATVPASPSTTAVPTLITGPVAKGSIGDDVRRVEQRLHDLGFFVGEIDGEFDDQTQRAVWAWKKLTGPQSWQEFERDQAKSTVTPEIWVRISDPLEVAPRRPGDDSSTHVEVYLPEQVLVVFTANEPVLIAHISSGEVDDKGNPTTFCEVTTIDTDVNGEPIDPPQERAFCAESKTPGGVFHITRRHDGKRIGPLGGMYRPQYFNYGIAIHGAENVPPFPVSHGAIRVTNAAADGLWELLDTGDTIYVWGQDGQEPESYTRTESLPSFNRPDPNTTASP